jgi:HEPN domain-containing protein
MNYASRIFLILTILGVSEVKMLQSNVSAIHSQSNGDGTYYCPKRGDYQQKHECWLAYAHGDLETAKILSVSEEIIVASILFHTQQCAEKALKAYLVFNNVRFERTHDLVELVHSCSCFDHEFAKLTHMAAALTPFAIGSRYPDGCINLPGMVEISICRAQDVLHFVRDKIENHPVSVH